VGALEAGQRPLQREFDALAPLRRCESGQVAGRHRCRPGRDKDDGVERTEGVLGPGEDGGDVVTRGGRAGEGHQSVAGGHTTGDDTIIGIHGTGIECTEGHRCSEIAQSQAKQTRRVVLPCSVAQDEDHVVAIRTSAAT
jgi:hypothetical protein